MRMHDSLRIMKRVAVKGVNAKRLLNWKNTRIMAKKERHRKTFNYKHNIVIMHKIKR